MPTPCLVVLTARGPSRLLREGGTQAWRLKPENVERMMYCVCVQNRPSGHNWGEADQEHHHAFMVGRISEVVPSPEGRPGRYLVKFSEYTRVDYPNAWPGLRNPIRYGTLEDFGVTGVDEWLWHPMPPVTARSSVLAAQDEDNDGPGPLTIPEAKAGLALGLGVPESSVEISIRY